MDTSFLSVEKVFDGVQLIAKPLKGRLSRSAIKSNTTAAKAVQRLLSDPKNRSIILTLLCQLADRGIVIGMSTEDGVSSDQKVLEYYASRVTKLKRAARTW